MTTDNDKITRFEPGRDYTAVYVDTGKKTFIYVRARDHKKIVLNFHSNGVRAFEWEINIYPNVEVIDGREVMEFYSSSGRLVRVCAEDQ